MLIADPPMPVEITPRPVGPGPKHAWALERFSAKHGDVTIRTLGDLIEFFGSRVKFEDKGEDILPPMAAIHSMS